MKKYTVLIISIILTILSLFIKPILEHFYKDISGIMKIIYEQAHIVVIIFVSWSLIEILRTLKRIFLSKFDISKEDNLTSRKVYTQVNILEKVIIFVIILFALGMVLLSFESIRKSWHWDFCIGRCCRYNYWFVGTKSGWCFARRYPDCHYTTI